MKTLSKLKRIFLVILCITFYTCSDDNDDGEQTDLYPISYASFDITGPITEGEFVYRDENESDDFSSRGRLYTIQDEPDLDEDQIQLYVGKSFTESNFLLVAPPEVGTYNFVHQAGVNSDLGLSLLLSSLEDSFSEKDVTVTITELEINGNTVTHCIGTFSGSFYRANLDEADVHQINGEFEINN